MIADEAVEAAFQEWANESLELANETWHHVATDTKEPALGND